MQIEVISKLKDGTKKRITVDESVLLTAYNTGAYIDLANSLKAGTQILFREAK